MGELKIESAIERERGGERGIGRGGGRENEAVKNRGSVRERKGERQAPCKQV